MNGNDNHLTPPFCRRSQQIFQSIYTVDQSTKDIVFSTWAWIDANCRRTVYTLQLLDGITIIQ